MFNQLMSEHYNLDKIQIKDKLIQGGGGSIYFNYVNLILGIVLITLGFISLFYNNFWIETDASILKVSPSKFETKLLIKYVVNKLEFTKILLLTEKINYKSGDNIKIFYDKNDPNLIKTALFNHKITGSILMLIGIYLVILKYIDV